MTPNHQQYVDRVIAGYMQNDDTLSPAGALMIWHEICFMANLEAAPVCDVCLCDDWRVGRNLVGYPSGKARGIRMAVLECLGCGQAKLFPITRLLQRIKINKMERLRDGEESITALFEAWRARLIGAAERA